MHSVNSSIAVSSLMHQPWISPSNKSKILEYKGRLDLLQYASRGCPRLLIDEISSYIPRKKEASDWAAIFERVNQIDDDGHAAKLVRALAHGQRTCAPWEESEAAKIKDKMWLQLGNMGTSFFLYPARLTLMSAKFLPAIDSVEDTANRWVRHAGFDRAWERYVLLSGLCVVSS